jgi:hypothetical protein
MKININNWPLAVTVATLVTAELAELFANVHRCLAKAVVLNESGPLLGYS